MHIPKPNSVPDKTVSQACLPQKGIRKRAPSGQTLKCQENVHTYEERFYRVNGRWRKGDLFGWRS